MFSKILCTGKYNKIIKYTVACFFLTLTVSLSVPVEANQPYVNYTYTYQQEAALEPQAYIPERIIDTGDMETGPMLNPNDVFESDRGDIYIADSGNNRIIVLDSEFNFLKEIKGYETNGIYNEFSNPQGIFVTKNNDLYVADTGNSKIVVLNPDCSLKKTMEKPETGLLTDDFAYEPIKVGVDYAERVFVVSKNVNDGIIEFDPHGNFVGFFGAVKVSKNIGDVFWKLIATKEQRQRMARKVPTEYSAIDVDSEGFVYGTVSAVDTKNLDTTMFIHKLNPMGNDVLKRDGIFAPMGDVKFVYDNKMIPQTSILVDVTVRENGIYSVLDRRMGRVFTYDLYGDLLYVFGGNGSNFGQFGYCSALTKYKGDKYLVADSKYNQLILFTPTKYGDLINEAVILYDKRRYDESEEVWKQVLKYTSKSEIAFNGAGMNLMRNEKYKDAMEFFKLANSRGLYSEAYKYHRIYLVNKYFSVFIVLSIILIIIVLIKTSKKKNQGRKKLDTLKKIKNSIKYSKYLVFHPFKAMWDLKHEGIGNMESSVFFIFALIVIKILRRQLTGYIFNYNIIKELNIFSEIGIIVIPFLLWCISNWSITTLMDGEGSFKDIFITTAYSLVPVIGLNIPLLILSRILTIDEGALYTLIDTVSVLWAVGLLLIGIMTIHQFTMTKTVVTVIIAILGMLIMVSLAVLFFLLIQQFVNFAILLYNEVSLR